MTDFEKAQKLYLQRRFNEAAIYAGRALKSSQGNKLQVLKFLFELIEYYAEPEQLFEDYVCELENANEWESLEKIISQEKLWYSRGYLLKTKLKVYLAKGELYQAKKTLAELYTRLINLKGWSLVEKTLIDYENLLGNRKTVVTIKVLLAGYKGDSSIEKYLLNFFQLKEERVNFQQLNEAIARGLSELSLRDDCAWPSTLDFIAQEITGHQRHFKIDDIVVEVFENKNLLACVTKYLEKSYQREKDILAKYLRKNYRKESILFLRETSGKQVLKMLNPQKVVNLTKRKEKEQKKEDGLQSVDIKEIDEKEIIIKLKNDPSLANLKMLEIFWQMSLWETVDYLFTTSEIMINNAEEEKKVLYYKILFYLMEEDFVKTLKSCQVLRELKPNEEELLEILYLEAKVYRKMKNVELEKEALAGIVKINPNYKGSGERFLRLESSN